MLDDPLSTADSTDSTPEKSARTVLRQGAFLAGFLKYGRINAAAEHAQIDRGSHYHWLKTDPEYAKLFADADEEVTGGMEDEAHRRAVDGVLKPATVAGERAEVREYSDTLLIFLLKARRPEKYRERFSHEHTGKDGAPLMPIEVWDALFKAARESKQSTDGGGA